MTDFIKKYLNEESGVGGIIGNDDKAPNTLLIGDINYKTNIDSINGKLIVHKPVGNHVWNDVEYNRFAADVNNYHQSLKSLEKLINRGDFKGIKYTDIKAKHKSSILRGREDKDDYQLGVRHDKTHDADVMSKISAYITVKDFDNKHISPSVIDKPHLFKSKSLGIDVMVGESCDGSTAYMFYPYNEDFTLELVDIADEKGLMFECVDIEDFDEKISLTILKEFTTIDGIASDDDYPVGNIIWGEKMVPELIDTINGKMLRYKSDPNFTWTEFERCRGMDDKKNYHSSLLGIEKLINRNDFSLDKYIGRSKDDAAIMKKRMKINAKEPIGKEPTTSVKIDVTKADVKTKVKDVNKKKEEVPVGNTVKYSNVKATSIDKDISDTVMKHIGECNSNTISDKIHKWIE